MSGSQPVRRMEDRRAKYQLVVELPPTSNLQEHHGIAPFLDGNSLVSPP